MNSLVEMQSKDNLTLDSREVAEMMDIRHSDLLEKIDNHIKYLTNGKLRSLDFFFSNTYQDSKGEQRPNYQITKKGCELIAHKMTGQKGTLFTATYINKFHEMESALVGIHEGQPVSITKENQEKLFIQKQRSEAMLLNARTRQAKLIYEIQKNSKLSPVSVELLNINALEVMTGKHINYRPEVEKTYTATEISEELGISANKIGKLANANGLKTSEYGISVLDKSRHSNKQVSSFRYNQKGKARLLEILSREE